MQDQINFFGVSADQLKGQYLKNAKVFEQMHNKALATGKKVNGYTAKQLEDLKNLYYAKSN